MSPSGDPAAILLGGRENTLSCARAFRQAGIPVVVIDQRHGPALRSRGVRAVSLGDTYDAAAATKWLSEHSGELAGGVLIPLSDEAMAGLIGDDDVLSVHYRRAAFDPAIVADMLDKERTLELARAAGVPVPRSWVSHRGADGPDDDDFPIVVKPVHGHEADTKNLRADDRAALDAAVERFGSLPSGYVLNEFIPGGDDLLSSYYALRDADGTVHLEFTKRVDRRNPPHKGGATFHELVHLPATAEVGRRFFEHIGLVGLGNVEFKLDTRSGELKIIECNHRITAALPLMQGSGIDLALAVYHHALGRPVEPVDATRLGGVLWYPVRDLISWRMSGEGIRPWLRRPWRTALWPYWRWSDPRPSFSLWSRHLRHAIAKRRRRFSGEASPRG